MFLLQCRNLMKKDYKAEIEKIVMQQMNLVYITSPKTKDHILVIEN